MVLTWEFAVGTGRRVLRDEGLNTSRRYRRKGVGGNLMQHAVDLAVANHASRLQLETDDENMPARTLYSQLGFECIPGKGVYMLFL